MHRFISFRPKIICSKKSRWSPASCQQTTHHETDVCEIMCGERKLRSARVTPPLIYFPVQYEPFSFTRPWDTSYPLPISSSLYSPCCGSHHSHAVNVSNFNTSWAKGKKSERVIARAIFSYIKKIKNTEITIIYPRQYL